jgi:phage terminase Nu1 subunit (DNA packaging protein)
MQHLGEAMTIGQVAELFGCSEWTVRQKLVPAGLPVFRFSPSGKLTFFREQVVAWVLERQNQQQGGTRR